MPSMWFLRNICHNIDYKLEKPLITVGRHKVHDIECRNNAISRNHAELTTVGDDLFIKAHKSLNGTYLNGRRLDDSVLIKLTNNDLLNFGFPSHPDCDQTINHYCYRVINRKIDMRVNTSEQLINILEGNDETQPIKEEPPDIPEPENKAAETSPIYSNKDDVIYIDDDDDFELFSQKAFDDRITIKSEPVECIEISDCESEEDIFNLDGLDLDGLKAMIDNIGCVDVEVNKDVNENINEKINENINDPNENVNGNITDDQNKIIESIGKHVKVQEVLKENNKDTQLHDKSKTPVDRSFITQMKHSRPIIVSPHVEVVEKRKKRKSVDDDDKAKKANVEKDKHGGKRRRSVDVAKANGVIESLIDGKSGPKRRRKSLDGKVSKNGLNLKEKNGKIKCKDIKKISNGVKEVEENLKINDKYTNGINPLQASASDFWKTNEKLLQNVTVPKKLSFRNLDYSKPSTSNLCKTTKTSTITAPSSVTDVPKDSYIALLKNGTKNSIYPTNRNAHKKTENNLSNKIFKDSIKENSVQRCTNFNGNRKDPRLNSKNCVSTNEIPTTSKAINYSVNQAPTEFSCIPRRRLNTIFKKPSFEIVLELLFYNVAWLEEYQKIQKPPPIIQNNIVRMCNLYNTYKDYCNVVKPFIMLELWDHLCSEYTTNTKKYGSKRFVMTVNEVTKYDRYQKLCCIGHSNSRNKKEFPKEGDVVMMHLGVRLDNDKTGLKCVFAYMVSCKEQQLKSNGLLPNKSNISTQFAIQLIIKPFSGEVLIGKNVDAMIITHVTSILREYDALMLMEKSQVFNLTLNPKVESFMVKRDEKIDVKAKGLSKSQLLAVQEACTLCAGNRSGLYMIQGPPGTGKTTVIRNIIETLVGYKPDIKILVVAPSNVTIDGIIRKLAKVKKRQDLVRLGKYESVSSDLHYYYIDSIVKRKMTEEILRERPEVRLDFNKLKERAIFLRTKINTSTNNHGNSHHLIKELKSVEHEINNFAQDYFQDSHYWNIFHRTRRDVVMRTNIICSTLNSCVRLEDFDLNIDCCIIDEASQSKETETLIPLSLGVEKVVLVGDPKQLPAVTLSKYAKDLGYGQSLMSRLKKAFKTETKQPITMLDLQFRMHPEICLYPSETFYEGMLKTASMCHKRGGLDGLAPYYVLNINSNHQVDERLENGYYNKTEINCVVKLLKAINDTIGHNTDKSYTVGVITPYNTQRRDLLVEIEKLRMPSIKITVNTVDSFQGSEKDIIILSCVRLRANSFLNDEQRLNVSLTRARRVLYVVGTHPLFDTCSTLKNLKENAKNRKLYFNIPDVTETILKSIIVKRP